MFQGIHMNKYYDPLASQYDQLIQDDIIDNKFPYSAYEEIQYMEADFIFENKNIDQVKILDIGIGTGSLYEKINKNKLDITGIDISAKMLDIAHLRLPDACLIKHDIIKGLPRSIYGEKFDYIIINYLFKHYELEIVISIINQLIEYLAPFGKIFIGDICFLNDTNRKLYLSSHKEILDSTYYFHAYSEIVNRIDDNLALSFMEMNEYSGIVIIEKYYETSLHFEESLIKYKTNTVKWKSNQTQKNRE